MRASYPDRSAENRHRALSSRTRLRLLDLLREADRNTDLGRRDAHALAGELGLHVNTVRAHLAILERNGLVVSEPEDRRVRGRPRILYRAAAVAEPATDEGYRFLATVLAGTLESDTAEPGRLAQEAGERWGRHLVEAPEPGHRSGSADAVGRAVALLDDLGFAPHVDDDDPGSIELHRCPYRELAIDHADVVCGIHLGILRGALAGSEASVGNITLTPFVSETMCVARVSPVRTASGSTTST